MMETVILLKPDRSGQGAAMVLLVGSEVVSEDAPEALADHKSPDELIMVREGSMKDEIPGVTNSWTYPIKARIDIALHGREDTHRHQDHGRGFADVQGLGEHIEMLLKDVPGTKVSLLNVPRRVLRRFKLSSELARTA